MTRHVYQSVEEKKRDQIKGFVMAIVVNIVIFVFGAQQNIYVSLAPWIMNIVLLVATLKIRHQVGLGYLTAIACMIGVPLIVGVVFIASCFISVAVTIPFASAASPSGAANIASIITIGATLIAVIGVLITLIKMFNTWQNQTLEQNDQPVWQPTPRLPQDLRDRLRAESEKESSGQGPDRNP